MYPHLLKRLWGTLSMSNEFKFVLICLFSSLFLSQAASTCKDPDYMKCNNNKCISVKFWCNGIDDCGDFSDEYNCTESIHQDKFCSDDSFRCLDGFCIPHDWVCDGTSDCLDGSDESTGCVQVHDCEKEGGFLCTNHHCLPIEFKCDGIDDCGDNSDEMDCAPKFDPINCNINHHKYLCSDRKQCIDVSDVCNNKSDCADSSDEGGLCLQFSSECKEICNKGQICIKTPLKNLCVCPKGQEIKDFGVCADMDECLQFGICDQKCVNLIGSYSCECIEGYSLQPDNKTCKGKGGEGLLVFSSEHEIRAYFVESKVYFPIISNVSYANGVAYNGHHVYWTDIAAERESINKADEVGSNIEQLVTFGLGTPENIALDWITENIYFTDSQLKHIGICTKTGEYCTVLHNDGLDNPRGISLVPLSGEMYWSDWGKYHCIAKSSMDGSNRTNFIDKDIFWPNGITVDVTTERLYWVDALKKVIESIKLDGSDRRVIVHEAIQHPFSIAVYENELYWSDLHGNQIISCNKFTCKNQTTVIKKRDSRIINVNIYNPNIESVKVQNPCFDKCSHICLLKKGSENLLSHTCACPPFLELSLEGKKCIDKERYDDTLYAGFGNTVIEIKYNVIGKKFFNESHLWYVGVIGDLGYNSLTDTIYISDLHKRQVYSINRKTLQYSHISSINDDLITAMDYDYYGNNIYWLDGRKNSVKVLSLNTMSKTTIIANFGSDSPSDMVLVPEFGVMFVSLFNNTHTHIDKISMDGTIRYHFIEKDLIGPSVALAYDSDLQRIFLADQGTGYIVSCNVQNADFHKFREHLAGPSGISVLGDYIFWVNFGSDKIYWANKFNADDSDMVTSLGKKGIDKIKLISTKMTPKDNESRCFNNGNCSHICLLQNLQQVCTCPAGMKLMDNGLICENNRICALDEFKCTGGSCIPVSSRCNNIMDCPTGEDEHGCQKVKEPCSDKQFQCHDKTYCIEKKNVCDSIEDCLDGSDEKDCLFTNRQPICSSDMEFICGSGECIPAAYRCDDRIDCKDHSDENNCKLNYCDPSTTFKCNSGACIPKSWECDTELDCPDASDEHKLCNNSKACPPTHLTCLNHKCIDKKLKCNGWDDCDDNSDEVNCGHNILTTPKVTVLSNDTKLFMCNQSHFACVSHMDSCLPLSARCNGSSECPNKEDETNCGECLFGYFECETIKECIPEVWVCDGMADCVDKSDEDMRLCHSHMTKENIINTSISCSGMECKDTKKCIPLSKVCDKIPDCDDKSDESGLCGMGCEFAGCSETCQETPSGAQCQCSKGYSLNADGRTCDDINECLLKGTCSHYCHNTLGSFQCSCYEAYYQLRDDRRRCKAKGPEMEFIYLCQNELRAVTASHSKIDVLYDFKQEAMIDGLVIHKEENKLYWSSRFAGKIYIMDLKNPSFLQEKGDFLRPSRIALDWITGNVYIVESGYKIRVCNKNISKCLLIYTGEEDVNINAINVDPSEGWLFWGETHKHMAASTKAVVKKASLTGRNVTPVLTHDLVDVTDISLDIINKEIYWSDGGQNNVGKATYNGSKIEILFVLTEHPINIAIFEDNIYINTRKNIYGSDSTSKQGVIQRCSLHSPYEKECSYIRLLPAGYNNFIKRIILSHQSLQIKEPNVCLDKSCSGVCIIFGRKPSCWCSNGSLSMDDGTCPVEFLRNEDSKPKAEIKQESHFKTFSIVMLMLILIAGAGYGFLFLNKIKPFYPFKFQNKSLGDISIQYNNPTYEMEPSLVDNKGTLLNKIIPGAHHFENPLFKD